MNLPDLNGLATLKAVVEYGGVREAACALHIGQPAVTKRLRALDGCYGATVMHRVRGRLRLTPAGERVYATAVQLLERHAILLEDLARLREGRDLLRLEVTSAIGEHLLPDYLLQFAESHPGFRLDTRMGYSRRIQTRLATGSADLALLELAPDHPEILVQRWRDDELVLVCGADHPQAGTDLLPITELAALRYVLREATSAMRDTLTASLRSIGIERIPIAMEVGSTDAIVEILERGRHASFLPRFAVDGALRAGTLFHIKVQGFRILRTLWIARHRSNIDHPAAEAFIRLLRETDGHPG